MHWENSYSIFFQIEWDMVVVTVFLSILNKMDFHLVQNPKENCPHDLIPCNSKGNGIQVFSACNSGNAKGEKLEIFSLNCRIVLQKKKVCDGRPLCPDCGVEFPSPCTSRHNGGPLWAPLQTPRYNSDPWCSEGFEGPLIEPNCVAKSGNLSDGCAPYVCRSSSRDFHAH